MDILEHAIEQAGGVGKLAESLGIGQNVVSNWRMRSLPRPWRLVLLARHPEFQETDVLPTEQDA